MQYRVEYLGVHVTISMCICVHYCVSVCVCMQDIWSVLTGGSPADHYCYSREWFTSESDIRTCQRRQRLKAVQQNPTLLL